jgi:stage V sporulation protein R
MRNFKDESFILQYLSPKVIRDLKLFSIEDDYQAEHYHITAIHDESGYRYVREQLSLQYNLSMQEPNIQIWDVDLRGDRSLTLRHIPNQHKPLANNTENVLKHVHRLWGFDVHLYSVNGNSVDENETLTEFHCPPLNTNNEKTE